MKILKIKKGKGYIATPTNNSNPNEKQIEETTKEDILNILDYMISNDIEMDEMTEENDLLNPVQKIIYSELYSHFSSFLTEKENIIKEVNDKFKEAENKYK